MYRLYWSASTGAFAPEVVLTELDLPFSRIEVDTSRDEHLQASYLAVNPRGQVPALALLMARKVAGPRFFVGMAAMVVLGGALYRFSTFLFAFNPGEQWSYFPSLTEFAVTIGFISAEILGYVVMVKLSPILRGSADGDRHGDPEPSVPGERSSAGSPSPADWKAEVPVMARSPLSNPEGSHVLADA